MKWADVAHVQAGHTVTISKDLKSAQCSCGGWEIRSQRPMVERFIVGQWELHRK